MTAHDALALAIVLHEQQIGCIGFCDPRDDGVMVRPEGQERHRLRAAAMLVRLAEFPAAEFANGTEPYALVATCDWGDCDEPTIAIRHNDGEWLSVCRLHVADADADAVAPIVPSLLPPRGSERRVARASVAAVIASMKRPAYAAALVVAPAEWNATIDAVLATLARLEVPLGEADEPELTGPERPCPACGAAIAFGDTHFELMAGVAGAYVCPGGET